MMIRRERRVEPTQRGRGEGGTRGGWICCTKDVEIPCCAFGKGNKGYLEAIAFWKNVGFRKNK